MMREMEKLFESLKYEFNQKMSNIGYFTNFNDPIENHVVNAGGSITDSFEDISLEDEILGKEKTNFQTDFQHNILLSNGSISESIPFTCDNNNFSKPQEETTLNPFVEVIDNHEIEICEIKQSSDISEIENTEIVINTLISEKISNSTDNYQIFAQNVSEDTVESIDDVEKEMLPNDINENEMVVKDVCLEIEQSNKNIESVHVPVIIGNNITSTTFEEKPFIEIIIKEDDFTKSEEDQSDLIFEYEQVELDSNNDFINTVSHLNNEEINLDEYKEITSNDMNKYDYIIKTDKEIISHINKPIININEINEASDNEIFEVLEGDVKIEEPKKEIQSKSEEILFDTKPVLRTLSYPVKLRKTTTERSSHNRKSYTSNRRMWSEMPEVIESGILNSISKKKIQLQEAMFEIITSEASYYQSLMILTTHFFQSKLFEISDNKENIVSPIDKHHIFSNVILIMTTSLNLLNDLEQRWHEEKPLLSDVCDVVFNHVIGEDFQHYVTYLRNQQYQTQALKRLSENEIFKQQLAKLEASAICGKLALDSFLLLPMQRLTRLKLLVEAISKLHNSEELTHHIPQSTKTITWEALEELKKLLSTSNTEKGFMDQKGALLSLINRIDYPPNFKRITFSNRILLREEELRVHQQTPLKTIRKFSKKKQPLLTLLLFNDLLVIAKKKGPRLLVLDYCDRLNVQAKLKFYAQEISSNDVSSNVSIFDISTETQVSQKSFGSTLLRSKTSLSSDEKKRLSIPLNNYFGSMPSISKIDDHETKYQTFSLQLQNSHSDIFNNQIFLTANTKEDRDAWLAVLNEDKQQSQTPIQFKNKPKLPKSLSLKMNSENNEASSLPKDNCFRRVKDDIAGEILAQSEITQNWNYEFLMNKFNYEMDFDFSIQSSSKSERKYSRKT